MSKMIASLMLSSALLASIVSPNVWAGDEKWLDLFPSADLKGWKRVAIAPDTKPAAKNPWKVNAETKLLECDGVGIKEMLLHETPRGAGVFRVSWRFRKVDGKSDYNGGVYVRTSADGKIWHQAQVAHQDKPPRYGDLFGETLVKGTPMKFLVEGQGAKLINPPGDWNTYEVTSKGATVTVAVNGKLATTWNDCEVTRGHIGLQAEFFFVEFKELKFRPID